MKNLASIKNYEDYKGVHMLMNQKIRRDFVAKMYGFFLTQMVISLFICSLTRFEPVQKEFKDKGHYLACFILCFPLNIVIAGFLSCGRSLLRNYFIQSLFISLGTIFITFLKTSVYIIRK